ncbi:unnamed protein product [Adineta steineri]|uniref:Uncharacterized protein n=1 Tax=Adineta steineri TaxID=433720 RepID=A0A814LWS9_9BILA|nr:unnamed protein product [Adineta steineri]CAF1122719.1 unnamed protein product [Adineta steineri]
MLLFLCLCCLHDYYMDEECTCDIVFIISKFSISIYKLYSIATIHETKSKLRQSTENTIFNVSVISLFLNNIITFYINTLCGTIFGKELIRLFRPLQQIIY